VPARRPHRPLRARVSGALACAVLALGAGAAAAGATPAPEILTSAPAAAAPAAVPREVLVRFRAGTSASERGRVAREAGVTLLSGAAPPGVRVARTAAGDSPAEAAAHLRDEPEVAWAEPNRIRHAAGVPNDPLFPQLWAQRNVGQDVNGRAGIDGADADAVPAWDMAAAWLADHPAAGAPIVAVVDTGVAYAHPDLAGAIAVNAGESGGGKETNGIDDDGNGLVDDWHGWDWVDGDNDPFDPDGHGTHVAGAIAARAGDGYGVSGMDAWARILPLRVLGPAGGTDAVVADAFDYAASMGARVVNASLSGDGPSMALESAIAAHPGVLFVVAAGNDSLDVDATPQYPCAAPQANVICVAATDQDDVLASFSNHGAASVDLAAPGTNILSSVPAHDVRLAEGFEAGAGAWALGGTWAVTAGAASHGAHSLSDSPAGPYANGTSAIARLLTTIDLTGGTGCRVRFDVRLATALDGDALLVEASRDGVAWTRVLEAAGQTGGSFVPVEADLSTLDGAPAGRVRLRMVTGASGTDAGVEVDDLEVGCVAPGVAGGDFAFESGTSMAAPQVAGAAALLMTAAPGLSGAAVKTALMSGVDHLPGLAAATASGGRLNAARALSTALAQLGGPAPDPDRPATGPDDPGATTPPQGPVVLLPADPRPLRAGGGGRAAADPVAPRLLGLALGRAAGGERVAVLRLAEAARVRVTVQRRRAGRVARYATVRRTAERSLGAGVRRVALGPLTAGRYRLLVRMTDRSGNRATAVRTLRLR
jgi:subtilisin family serine protease